MNISSISSINLFGEGRENKSTNSRVRPYACRKSGDMRNRRSSALTSFIEITAGLANVHAARQWRCLSREVKLRYCSSLIEIKVTILINDTIAIKRNQSDEILTKAGSENMHIKISHVSPCYHGNKTSSISQIEGVDKSWAWIAERMLRGEIVDQ